MGTTSEGEPNNEKDDGKGDKSGTSPLSTNPEGTASFLSRLFFCFMYPLFITGYKRELEQEDLFEPLSTEQSEQATSQLEAAWNSELECAAKKDVKPSLLRTVRNLYWRPVFLFGLLIVAEQVCSIVQALLMGRLIRYFRVDSSLTHDDALIAAGGVCFTAALTATIHHPQFYGLQKIGMRLKVAASGLVARKAFSLSSSGLRAVSIGKIVNMLSTDVLKFDMAFVFVHYLWLWPILLVTYSAVIWTQIGPASVAGYGCMLLLFPAQFYFSRMMGTCRRDVAARSDKRISVMNEILSGIRLIKMYGWEEAFSNVVAKLRHKEMNKLRWFAFAQSMLLGLFWPSGKLVLLFAALCYVLTGNDLTSEKIFVASALYNSSRLHLMLFGPLAMHTFFELRVSCQRIQEFLEVVDFDTYEPVAITENGEPGKDEEAPLVPKTNQRKLPPDNSWADLDLSKNNDPEVVMKGFSACWDVDALTADGEEGLVLKNIDLEAKKGQLILIVGTVGSGKSSLLASIMKETIRVAGTLKVRGRPAFCAQDAWLFSGTILENVLFGNKFEEERFHKACYLSCLEKDLEEMPEGRLTHVGDRGLNLSGGQRARVSLARAIYSQADVFLLDDPLSAVDPAVAKHIFELCLNEYLLSGVVIVATHQLQFIRRATYVIAMENGRIAEQGTPEHMARYFSMNKLTRESTSSDPGSIAVEPTAVIERERLSSVAGSILDELFEQVNESAGAEELLIKKEKTTEADVLKEADDNEDRASGTVSWSVYWEYVMAFCSSIFLIIPMFGFSVLVQLIYNYTDFLLNQWATTSEKMIEYRDNPELVPSFNTTFEKIQTDNDYYMYLFSGLTLLIVVLSIIRCIWIRVVQTYACENLHKRMFKAVLYTNAHFFDKNPVGRILNRFSKDVHTMDDPLAFVFFEFFVGLLGIVGIVGMIVSLNPFIFLLAAPLCVFFVIVRSVYLSTSRSVKRLEAISRSPLYAHISSVMNGLITVRAYGRVNVVLQQYHSFMNINTAAFQLTLSTSRWFAIHIDWLVAMFVSCVTFASLYSPYSFSTGEVGLMLVYAVQLTGFFSWIVRQSAELQNAMVSLERIIEYSKLDNEQNKELELIPGKFPQNGAISFEKVCMRYEGRSEYALNSLSVDVKPWEKVGIVGRTGAGKSSIIRALFRLTVPESGRILIDGIDTATIPLTQLRKGIAIIPQEPVLFLGTVRYNLDPFDEFTDEQLWTALDQVELKSAVHDLQGGLEARMQEGGTNFSVGQRQLVCLARALLRKATVLVLDEATANVDLNTDKLIHRMIREGFGKCTVLTIAHRLHTIMDSDKILVMDEGRLIEEGTPLSLIEDKKSLFRGMVEQTGSDTVAQLYKLAKERQLERIAEAEKEDSS